LVGHRVLQFPHYLIGGSLFRHSLLVGMSGICYFSPPSLIFLSSIRHVE
jgi:hypothetical protein